MKYVKKINKIQAFTILALIVVFILLFPIPMSRSRGELYTITETYYDEVPQIVNETISVPYSVNETVSIPYQVAKYMRWQVTWYTLTMNREWGASVGTQTFDSTFGYWWGYGDVYGGYSDGIGFNATGSFYLEEAGMYEFTLGSDDRSKLFIDGNVVIDLWTDGGHNDMHKVYWLSKGLHTALLTYYDWTDYAKIYFDIDKGDLFQWEETQYLPIQIPRIYYNQIQIPRIQIQQVPKQRTTVANRTVTETIYVSLLEYLMNGGKV